LAETAALGELERRLINRYQGGFPLCERPFDALAEALDSDSNSLLQALKDLLEQGWLSRFGPLFNAERLGGGLSLAALAVPEPDYAQVAEALAQMPEVAHNYRREHELNMWFVLATASPEGIDASCRQIEQATGLEVFNFPKQREFYLGLWLELDEQGGCQTRPIPSPQLPGQVLDPLDQAIVSATQAGLPLLAEPYRAVAEQLDCSSTELLQRLARMLETGVIRRIGLVPNHYKLGLRANGMSVWNIADEQLEQVGQAMGALDYVSHCYSRPRRLPRWPYNLFAMVHGQNREQVQVKVAEMAERFASQSQGHEVLFSSQVLKKTGMRL
jgi:DNA-binding Lrp family transcriptional regulator